MTTFWERQARKARNTFKPVGNAPLFYTLNYLIGHMSNCDQNQHL